MSSTEAVTVVEVTPWLRVFDEIDLFSAELDGDHVRARGGARAVRLNGEDFTRFRDLRTRDDVAELADEYGLLSVSQTVEPIRRMPGQLVLAVDAPWYEEPIADWIKLGGLLDIAFGLVGVMSDAKERQALYRAANRYSPPPSPAAVADVLAHQQAFADGQSSWVVRSVFGGSARAGFTFSQYGSEDVGDPYGKTHSLTVIRFFGLALTVGPGSAWAGSQLAEMLNPWLRSVRASVIAGANGLRPAQDIEDGGLLTVLWLQLVNAALSAVPPRRCAFQGCPGPPERPGVFLWQWSSGSKKAWNRTDSIYCHPKCQNAAKARGHRAKEKGKS